MITISSTRNSACNSCQFQVRVIKWHLCWFKELVNVSLTKSIVLVGLLTVSIPNDGVHRTASMRVILMHEHWRYVEWMGLSQTKTTKEIIEFLRLGIGECKSRVPHQIQKATHIRRIIKKLKLSFKNLV